MDDAQALFWMARAGKSKTYEDRLSEQGYVVWDSRDPERLLEWANDDQLRWTSLRGLSRLYHRKPHKNRIPQLRDLAWDQATPDNLRIVAMIAVRVNGHKVPDEPLIRWYRENDDAEMRMMALGALGGSRTDAARRIVVGALDDADLTLALIAVMAAGQQQNRDALPILTEWLARILDSRPWWAYPTRRVKRSLIDALAEIGGPAAASAVAEALRREVARASADPRDYVAFSTWHFERITGMHWSAAGAQTREVRMREARAALTWWDGRGRPVRLPPE